jgi:phosphoribosylaminoimidazole-succinocarboxamide synthase
MTLYESSLKSLPRIGKGKVRDIYAVGADKMLILVSDRLSAFDVVLSDPIPDKGRVLNDMANFWFGKLAHVVPNHLTGIDPETVVRTRRRKAQVRGRSIVVKKLKALPVEAVVRGYIIGSGWKDYQKTGAVCGITLPKGCSRRRSSPSRSSLRRRRPSRVTTRTSRSSACARSSASRSPRRSARRASASTRRRPISPRRAAS